MPTSIAESVDHHKRFQAAVDVIHNLPKNGSYRPSYEVMLSFYSLYKQAVCGPCGVSRPGFWDPVGRYKWDAWNRLGEMSSESAMAAYVEEMKKVAQEVIDTMPMNEKTASLFHHFEPLYVVIHDMPRPPGVLLSLREDILHSDQAANIEQEEVIQEQPAPGEVVPDQKPSQTDEATSNNEPQAPVPSAEGLVLTSDSESEIFCDSVDSVEQLDITEVEIPKSNGLHNGHAYSEPSSAQAVESVSQTTQAGAGQGGERAGEGRGLPMRRSRDTGRDGIHQEWRERRVPQGSPRRAGREAPGSGGGAGRGGGDGSEGGAERPQDLQVQQQIVTALRRLREDMRRVMDRLEVVERLAAAHAQSPDWRPCMQCAAAASHLEEDRWWPFDLSGRTTLLLLLWPFVAQGLVFLLRRGQRKSRISI